MIYNLLLRFARNDGAFKIVFVFVAGCCTTINVPCDAPFIVRFAPQHHETLDVKRSPNLNDAFTFHFSLLTTSINIPHKKYLTGFVSTSVLRTAKVGNFCSKISCSRLIVNCSLS